MSDELEIPGAEVETVNTQPTNSNIDLIDGKKVEAAAKKQKDASDAIEKARISLLAGYRTCQRCGHDTTVDIKHVSDEDKKAFLASVIGDTGYEKTYYAMGKIIEIKLKAAPSWFMTLVKDQLINDHRLQLVSTIDEYRVSSYHYCLVGCLVGVSINGVSKYSPDMEDILNTNNVKKRDELGNTILRNKFEEITLNWSDAVLSAVVEAQSIFNEDVDVLMKHARDPVFWESVTVK